jgi:hypothetical protein
MTSDADPDEDADAYGGLPGAFPYAARASDSWLFRAYVPVAALVAGVLTLLFGLSLLALVAGTAGMRGGSVTLSRAFFVVVGLLVAGPAVAPVLLVARRHRRRAVPPGARHDAGFALLGFLFLAATFVGVAMTVPPAHRDPVSGPLAVLVRPLYAADGRLGALPPLLAALLVALYARRTRAPGRGRSRETEAETP